LKDGIGDNLGDDLGIHVGRTALEGLKGARNLFGLMSAIKNSLRRIAITNGQKGEDSERKRKRKRKRKKGEDSERKRKSNLGAVLFLLSSLFIIVIVAWIVVGIPESAINILIIVKMISSGGKTRRRIGPIGAIELAEDLVGVCVDAIDSVGPDLDTCVERVTGNLKVVETGTRRIRRRRGRRGSSLVIHFDPSILAWLERSNVRGGRC